MKAKRTAIAVKTLGDLGLTLEESGAVAARTEVLGYTPPPRRQAGRVLEGDPAEVVKELVRLLREEAKVL
jgi:electron transfer flavoprotein beta subunit